MNILPPFPFHPRHPDTGSRPAPVHPLLHLRPGVVAIWNARHFPGHTFTINFGTNYTD